MAGTWGSIFGYGAGMDTLLETKDGEPSSETYFSLAEYLDRTEVWEVHHHDNGGNDIILGRAEKAEIVIKWNGKTFIHELIKGSLR